jgi:hypothetical protein
MKKLNAKFIASSVLAVIAASVMAVSAGAASYIVPPAGKPYAPVAPATEPEKVETPGETDKSPIVVTGSVIGESIIKDAISSGRPIEATISDGKLIIPEAAIAAIKEGGKLITINVSGSDIPYTVTIDPKDIDEVKDVNIAMNIRAGLPDGISSGTDLSKGVIFIGPEMKGTWPIALGLTIPASALKDMDFDKIGFYYIDDYKKIFDYSDDIVKNEKDKSITIVRLRHASAYVLSDVDLTAPEDGDIDAGLDIDDDDDGEIIDDVTIDEPSTTTGKDDTSVVVNAGGNDTNPVTGTTLALGSLAVFAAAAVATSKKRK